MIIITGVSGGVGNFLFDSFKKNKSELVLGIYNNSIPIDIANCFKINICEFDNIQSFVNENSSNLNNISLINCAGISYNTFTHKSDPVKWKNIIDVNLIGTYNVIRALLPIMRLQKFGRIINFSSVVAQKSTPGVSAYSASKSALWGLAKSVAIENASLNITINNINLGYSELGMINTVPSEYMSTIINQIPAGKLCEPNDILKTVNFLLQTSYITGSNIDLNGGLI